MMTRLALALATALGTGYSPVAPGTVGSAVGLLLWWLLPEGPVVTPVLLLLVFVVGSWSGTRVERHVHGTDPGIVVIDEVLGMLMTLAFVPVHWPGAVLGFLLFRVADIVKPYPANRCEALHGGVGIMADDAMAAVYAQLALRACVWGASAWAGVTL